MSTQIMTKAPLDRHTRGRVNLHCWEAIDLAIAAAKHPVGGILIAPAFHSGRHLEAAFVHKRAPKACATRMAVPNGFAPGRSRRRYIANRRGEVT
jgi:hypothetical protein